MTEAPNTTMNEIITDVREQLAQYAMRFPDEAQALRSVVEHLNHFGSTAFLRSNSTGHITTSGLVYDKTADLVLMIHHRALNRELQPGGHYEGSVLLHLSAAREVLEETGVVVEVPFGIDAAECLIDVDSHSIPANLAKGEDSHVHHDFLYLFSGEASTPLSPQWSEVRGARWMPVQRLGQIGSLRLARVSEKIKRLRTLCQT